MTKAKEAMVGDGENSKGAVGDAEEFAKKLKQVFDNILTDLTT